MKFAADCLLDVKKCFIQLLATLHNQDVVSPRHREEIYGHGGWAHFGHSLCPKLIFCPFYFGTTLCPKCIKLTVSRIVIEETLLLTSLLLTKILQL